MKQYLLAVHTDFSAPVDPAEMQDAFAAVEAFNKEVMDKNVWIFGGGLCPPASSTVVRPEGKDVVHVDGPYAETKEVLGGFWIIRAADLDAALAWAKKAALACKNPVEVRPFQDEE